MPQSFGTRYRWLFLALVLFLVQAVPYLSHRWVTDESWYAGPGFSIAQGHGIRDPAIGPNDLEYTFDARPPGTAIVISGFFRLLGTHAVAARLGSVFAGMAIVVLVFLLARRTFGPTAAACAALIIATDNLIVLVSRTARPEALTTAAILAALFALAWYAEAKTSRSAVCCGLLMALAVMFHITVLGYILSYGLLIAVLDWRRGKRYLPGVWAYTAGFFAGMTPFALWLLLAPLGHEGFRAEFLSRATQMPLLDRLSQETHRYADVLGFNMIQSHGLASVPVRIFIPACFLLASFLLWKQARRWFYVELLLLVPSLLWLAYTVNKSSRYVAIVAPLFALAIGGAAAIAGRQKPLRVAMLSAVAVIVAAQFGANLLLLHAASKADYTRVGEELRRIIPPGAPAYGTITFWLALHERPFISYERTEPMMALGRYDTHYFIVGDRMARLGGASGDPFYQTLDTQLAQLASSGVLKGTVSDPYYGTLKVFYVAAEPESAGGLLPTDPKREPVQGPRF